MMKIRICISILIGLGITLILTTGCKKDDETLTVKDRDGNVYTTITIGTQTWMVENLKTTKFNDGTSIPILTDRNSWEAPYTQGCCWYNNEEGVYKNTYGALYKWYTVNTGKLCPKGWHVPTDDEWTELTDFLLGEEVAGGKLKESGFGHWEESNFGGTNETGFTALPGGQRDINGKFSSNGTNGTWWSSTGCVNNCAWVRGSTNQRAGFYRYAENIEYGMSVRCLKDE